MRLVDPEQREQAQALLGAALEAEVLLERDPAALSVRVEDADRVTLALAELTNSGIPVTDFSLGRPSLDEVFMALTGHPAEEQTESTEHEEVTA